jgi:hypothetical protein
MIPTLSTNKNWYPKKQQKHWATLVGNGHAFVSKIELHLIHDTYLVLVFKSQHDEYIGIHVPMGKGLGLLL